jgi:hypothetical protein
VTTIGLDPTRENDVLFVNTFQRSTIEICKTTGFGVSGTFTFNIPAAGTPTGGASPAQTQTLNVGENSTACTPEIRVNPGGVTITEVVPRGQFVELVGLINPGSAPGAATPCSLISPATGPSNNPATVQVEPGASCKVTFLDKVETRAVGPGTVELKVCKIAGLGVPAGEPFGFTVSSPNVAALNQSVTVPAGTGSGQCASLGMVPTNALVEITENATLSTSPTAFSVTGGATIPGQTGTSLTNPGRSVTIALPATAGAQPVLATFTNEKATAFLQICKEPSLPGTFTFGLDQPGLTLSPITLTVPVGATTEACSVPVRVLASGLTISETAALLPFNPGGGPSGVTKVVNVTTRSSSPTGLCTATLLNPGTLIPPGPVNTSVSLSANATCSVIFAEVDAPTAPNPLAAKADFNGNGAVDAVDLAMFAQDFGKSGAGLKGDLDTNGAVNAIDLAMFASVFGTTVQ